MEQEAKQAQLEHNTYNGRPQEEGEEEEDHGENDWLILFRRVGRCCSRQIGHECQLSSELNAKMTIGTGIEL